MQNAECRMQNAKGRMQMHGNATQRPTLLISERVGRGQVLKPQAATIRSTRALGPTRQTTHRPKRGVGRVVDGCRGNVKWLLSQSRAEQQQGAMDGAMTMPGGREDGRQRVKSEGRKGQPKSSRPAKGFCSVRLGSRVSCLHPCPLVNHLTDSAKNGGKMPINPRAVGKHRGHPPSPT
ncbi:predicted protein [Plenodomus lingam JN3]|uniref:Predicted protein n=1 Tax=Leptosphaeria maculans (strain JN3 / isolate v23.1.3 / race Av1-4-5-6-7-8) TaxID=985895 RepID=E5A8L9_LEPMJ|nr:predicted protein [Plenodomus lingam JN3]CBX99964.1 predicted protein [Plenodomus lingam JN3]